MKSPSNTTAEIRNNPLLGLVVVMGGIENQEAQGQAEFVQSDTLPLAMDAIVKANLESAGVKFLGPVEGDDQFQYVELPAGWTKKRTEHSMWSDLVDEKGRKRAGIFYKAAFYDRSAHLHACARFSVQKNYNQSTDGRIIVEVKDGETVIHTVSLDAPESDYANTESAVATGVAWLDERFPDWRDHSKHWD